MRYEEYTIGKLFSSQNGDTDLQRCDISGTGIPVITSGIDNDGILGLTDREARVIRANSITIDMFGNAFFRPFEYKMVTHARVFSMEFLGQELDENTGLYIATQFHFLTKMFDYNNMCSYSKIKDLHISLPTLDTTDSNSIYSVDGYVPDFTYMSNYIVGLKKEHTKELKDYMASLGMSDCKLSAEERQTLTAHTVHKIFHMNDLFTKVRTSFKGNDKKQNSVSKIKDDEFSLPLINCKDGNNGIMYYGRRSEFSVHTNVLTIIYNGPPTEGQTYYQDEVGLYTDAYIVRLKQNGIMNREVGLYLTTSINKSIHNLNQKKYSRGNKATWEDKVEKDEISLPVVLDKDGTPLIDPAKEYHPMGYVPDFAYMYNYIRAIEKNLLSNIADYS